MPMTAKVLVAGLLLTCGVAFGADVKVCNGIPCATITDLGGGKYGLDVNATVTAGDLTTAAKGATAAGSPTSTSGGADRQMLDVLLRDSTGAEIPANANGQATMANSAPVVIASDYVPLAGWTTVTSGLSTATTLTELVAASGSNKVYIKNWKCSASVASGTTADNQCVLKYGTGTNCATGTAIIDGCFQAANAGCNGQEIVVPASQAVCWIHAAAGSKYVTITYRQAP